MTEIHFLVEDSPAGGFIAKASDQAISASAQTLPLLKINMIEAVNAQVDMAGKVRLIFLHF